MEILKIIGIGTLAFFAFWKLIEVCFPREKKKTIKLNLGGIDAQRQMYSLTSRVFLLGATAWIINEEDKKRAKKYTPDEIKERSAAITDEITKFISTHSQDLLRRANVLDKQKK